MPQMVMTLVFVITAMKHTTSVATTKNKFRIPVFFQKDFLGYQWFTGLILRFLKSFVLWPFFFVTVCILEFALIPFVRIRLRLNSKQNDIMGEFSIFFRSFVSNWSVWALIIFNA